MRFGGVAIGDFGEAGNRAIIASANGFEGELAFVKRLMRLHTLQRFRKDFQPHLPRHAVRADDGGQSDGAVACHVSYAFGASSVASSVTGTASSATTSAGASSATTSGAASSTTASGATSSTTA